MDLSDLIDQGIVDIPIDYDPKTTTYTDALKDRCNHYVEALKRAQPVVQGSTLDKLRTRVSQIENMAGQLITALSKHAVGRHAEAMDALCYAVRAPGKDVWKELVSVPLDNKREQREPLYRARVEKSAMLSREDLFHIPFERRHLVHTQRFSYPGLPCLYLGSSIACCWRELGQPPLPELWCARFEIADGQKLALFDLGYHPREFGALANSAGEVGDFVVDYLTFWPILAACSFRSQTENSSPNHRAGFVMEYVIPQLLLEYIRTHDEPDGLRHLSTKWMQGTTHGLMRNIVLPAQTAGPTGHCARLKQKLVLTEPLVKDHPAYPQITSMHPNASAQITGLRASPVHYLYTTFSELEAALQCAAVAGI